MRRWVALLSMVAAAGALIAVVAMTRHWRHVATVRPAQPGHAGHAGCPVPRVIELKARRGGERGRRIKLHVRADTHRGRIIALYPAWGDGRITIYDLRPSRRVSLELAYSYRVAADHTVTVVAESASAECGLLKSPPRTLRITRQSLRTENTP